jgi:ectoine hydroxylase
MWGKKELPGLHYYQKTGHQVERMFFDMDMIEQVSADALVMRNCYTGDGVIYENDEKTVRSIFGVHDANQVIADLLVTDELTELAMSILDSDVYVHQFHINYKQAFVGGGYFWHSDFTYWHWEDGMPDPRCVSMVIPLDYMPFASGPLYVHSGSHMYYGHNEFYRRQHFHPDDEVKHDEHDDGGATKEQLEMIADDNGRLDVFVGNPGDLFVMDANLLHMSAPNWSPYDRTCAFVCLNSVDNKLGAPRSGRLPRPQYITNRKG